MGLCIDLLDKLKEKMKFRYTIEESPNNVYGAPDIFTGEWSGMVRQLIDNVSLAFGTVLLYVLQFHLQLVPNLYYYLKISREWNAQSIRWYYMVL